MTDPGKPYLFILPVLLLLGPLPMLLKLGRFLWQREQYQFFPLMIAGAFLLGYERWRDVPQSKRLEPGSTRVAAGLAVTALLLLVGSALVWIQALAGLATILIFTAIGWRIGGWRLLRVIGPSLVLLLTILPPPGGRDQRITLQLQQLAVGMSSRLLDSLHVPHVQSGNVLEIPGRRLLVEQACSGINSLMAVLAFTLLYGFWKQRPIWWIILLLPAAGLFVLWGNIARITGEAWLKVIHNIDWLEGIKHELMGLGLFVGCVGLTLSFDALVGVIVDPFSRARQCYPVKNTTNRLSSDASSMLRIGWREWAIAVIFAFCGIWLQMRVRNAWTAPSLSEHAKFNLPEQLAGWEKISKVATLVERPQTVASTSFIWQYHLDDIVVSVALDYPFSGYHELSLCYKGSGWTINSQNTVNDKSGEFQLVEMEKVPSQYGLLLFNLNDEHQRSVPWIPDFSLRNIHNSLAAYQTYALGGPSYQVQVLAQRYSDLSPPERDEIKKLFLEARETLVDQLTSQMDKH